MPTAKLCALTLFPYSGIGIQVAPLQSLNNANIESNIFSGTN
jgi:hypothetical protein